MQQYFACLASFFTRDPKSNMHDFIMDSRSHSNTSTLLWIIGIAIGSTIYFLMYFQPGTLHDSAHYATAGISLVRDHKNLLYPYFPQSPGGMGPSYEYFQNKTIHFDVRTNYPSRLYVFIYGVISYLSGSMKFVYLQWISLVSFFIGNIFLYLIGRLFFNRINLLLFLLSVIFLPLMMSLISPGTDGIGYTASLGLLWLILSINITPFFLGLYAGILINFRGQMFSLLFVLPLIYISISNRDFFRRVFFPLLVGFIITFSITTILFNITLASAIGANPNDFYIQYFKNGTYCHLNEVPIVLNKLASNIIALFDNTSLFIYAAIGLFVALKKNNLLQRNLVWAAILYIAFPLVLYSFDRFALSQSRYYVFAVPLIVLSFFLEITNITKKDFFLITKERFLLIQTLLIFLTFYYVHGLPINQLNLKSIMSRAHFMEFEGVEQALKKNFYDNDVVIVNHSLPTGLSRLHNVIYLPPFQQFFNGNNKEIKGIIFVFSDAPPNNFFKPVDWCQNNKLPESIIDSKGVIFKQTYNASSNIVDSLGRNSQNINFYIYKNISY